MRERARLVRLVGERDDERHLADGLGSLEAARQRERGIDARTEQEHFDLAGGHRLHQLRDLCVRRRLAVGPIGTEAHGLADVAQGRVEERDDVLQLRRVGPARRGAAGDDEAGLVARQGARDGGERLERDAALFGHLSRIDLPHRARAVGAARFADHPEQRGGEHQLGARSIEHPAIGIGRRQRLPWLDVDIGPRAALAEGVHAREARGQRDVVDPRLDPVGAEVHDDLRVLEGVIRHRVAAERGAVGGADRLVGERLERHAGPCAQRLRPPIHQRAETSGLELRDHRDAARFPAAARRGHLVRERLERLVPADRREERTVAALRSGEAIGVVEALQRGLAADAEATAIDGMVGIALELDDASVAVACEDAAAGRTLATHRGEPRGDARHELLVGHHERQDGLGRLLAAAGSGGGARARHDLEEVASLHAGLTQARLIARSASARTPSQARLIARSASARTPILSGGTRCNRAERAHCPWRCTYGGSRRTSPCSAAAARHGSRPR